MEYTQMRDGRYEVYRCGKWIGTVSLLHTGQWMFLGRLARSPDLVGIGVTMEGAVLNGLKVLEQVQTEH